MLIRLTLQIILFFSVILFNAKIWTRDFEQAYMQSKPLHSDIFAEQPREAMLPFQKFFKI